jgi:hypothetical protein
VRGTADPVRDYLLGVLEGQEKEAVEDRLFTDDAFLARLDDAEEQLVREYVESVLSPEDKKRFDDNFLASPRRRRNTQMTRELMRIAAHAKGAAPAPVRKNWLAGILRMDSWANRFAITTAAVALLFAGTSGWLAIRLRQERQAASIEHSRLLTQQEQARDEMERLRAENQAAGIATPGKLAATQESIFSFVLAPGVYRDDKATLLGIPNEASGIRIKLRTDGVLTGRRCSVTIRRDNGDEIWRSDATALDTPHQAAILLPAAILRPGAYLLTLSTGSKRTGAEVIEDYSFRVVRR